jgi:nicotinamidase-related amidase
MRKALLLVDYIHDFVDDDGALTVGKPAQAIRENIARAISRLEKEDLLVMANDSHDWNAPHPEKKLFPPHALAGTRGAQSVLAQEAAAAACETITVNKTRYSAFFGTGLRDILKTAGIEKLYLAGVCTDICVLHTAADAYNFGFDTAVLTDCVASFNPPGHEFALSHFKNTLGFELITSSDL